MTLSLDAILRREPTSNPATPSTNPATPSTDPATPSTALIPAADGTARTTDGAGRNGTAPHASSDEQSLLALIDGRRSARDVVRLSGLPEGTVIRQLQDLCDRGLLDASAATAPTPSTSGAAKTQAFPRPALDPLTRKLLDELRGKRVASPPSNTAQSSAASGAAAAGSPSDGQDTARADAGAGAINPRVTSIWVPGSAFRPGFGTSGATSPIIVRPETSILPSLAGDPAGAASVSKVSLPTTTAAPSEQATNQPSGAPGLGTAAARSGVPAAPGVSSEGSAPVVGPPHAAAPAPAPVVGDASAPTPPPSARDAAVPRFRTARQSSSVQPLPSDAGGNADPDNANVNAPLPFKVGSYQVATRIGQGGMGSTYVCRRVGAVGFQRLFTLKVIRQHSEHKDLALRSFRREARVGALLSHPNVSTVVDVGTYDAQPFLIFDYVDGTSLADLVEQGQKVPPSLLVAILLDVLRGLQRAHELAGEDGRPLGLVHRDVSPQNILVGIDGVARLTDFGNARQTLVPEPGDADPVMVGKPAYMAPEQLCGEPIDARTDLFAVGAIMWGALTGEKLFGADSYDQTVMKVLRRRIPPPSSLGAPGALDDICLKALSRSREGRFASADEMAQALMKVAASNGLTASARDVGQWVQTHVGQELTERRRRIELMFRVAAGTPDNGVPTTNQPRASHGGRDARDGRDRTDARQARAAGSPRRGGTPARGKRGVAPTIFLSARKAEAPAPPVVEDSSRSSILPPVFRRPVVLAGAVAAWIVTLFLAYFVARGLRSRPTPGPEGTQPLQTDRAPAAGSETP